MSKSATTSPTLLAKPLPPEVGMEERSFLGVSHEREDIKTKRRRSGPARHSEASHGRQVVGSGAWPYPPRPYHGPEDSPSPPSSDSESIPPHIPQSPPQLLHRSKVQHYPLHLDYSPPQYSSAVRTTTSAEFAYTPSTSPFLGPLRTLNIHSTNASRAPSPVLPPHPNPTTGDVAIDDGSLYLHARSNPSSPPANSYFHRAMSSSKLRQHDKRSLDPASAYASHHNNNISSNIRTPQLSSGPSSEDSSPRSGGVSALPHNSTPFGLPPPLSAQHLHTSTSGSATSSRAPSPTHLGIRETGSGGHLSPQQQLGPCYQQHHHPHHHLARSVHAAFGMTPIHAHGTRVATGTSASPSSGGPGRSHSPPPRNSPWHSLSSPGSHPVPNTAPLTGPDHRRRQPHLGLGDSFSHEFVPHAVMSMPSSRSSSPPITLPPLKLLSLPGCHPSSEEAGKGGEDGDGRGKVIGEIKSKEGVEGDATAAEKVELPSFSQIDATTRGAREWRY
ncbi:hypothetical protein AX15_001038 [Amanita polypyramis BW_CC]|nr:hypothetical protein AX15_001038 [Amanita polypyramis BW_CC]